MVRSPLGIRRTRARLAAAGVALALALSACGGSNDGSDSGGGNGGGDGGTLTLGTVIAPTSLAADQAGVSPYHQALYDSLLRQAPDGSIEPWLATEWSYNDDRTVLTMTLRDDVTFTDGTPFTADVAAQNVLRYRDSVSGTGGLLVNVGDATAVDDTTLEITMSAPEPALLVYLAQGAGAQESPASFDAPDEDTNPIGSGPYVLDTDRTVVGSNYVFTKNEDYWAPDDQHYAEVVMNVYTTSQTIVNAIQGGQVNASPLLDNASRPQVEGAGFEVLVSEINWSGLSLFDRTGKVNPAFGDVRVRQAIAHAIDREAMLKGPGGGLGTVTGQIFAEEGDAFIPELDDEYEYDPDRARELLADAGYEDGFTLKLPYYNVGTDAVFDVTEQYLEDVGITVEYTTVALADIPTVIGGGQFAATLFPFDIYPTTWQVAKSSLAQDAGWNVMHEPDATVADLLATIQSGTEEEAATASKELNEYIVEQAWFVPFYRNQSSFAHDAETEVVAQSDNSYPQLHNISPAG